jgi:ABC-type transport system involved in cytochrome c biogenesis permease subunit
MIWEIRLLATLLPILYGLLSLAYALVFFRNDPVARRLAPRGLVVTLCLHGVYLGLIAAQERRVPIATSFEAMSALALALGIAYLVQEKRSGTPHTGVIFIPLIFMCQTLASAFSNPSHEVKPLLQSPLFGVHIATALLGYAAFAVSAIFGLLYVMLYHNLKAHRFGIVYERLPSLEVLSAMNMRAAVFGLGCLTLAIAVGAVWSLQVYPRFWQDPKVWLSLGAWAIYAICLLARYATGWRGPRIAYFTIAGFLMVVVSMLAVNRHGS